MNVTKTFGMLRDNQRGKLYKAQKILDQFAKPVATIKDVERFIDEISSRAAIKRRYGNQLKHQIIVKDGRGRSSAGGCGEYITLPLWARQTRTILHEIAHTIADRKYGRRNIAGHGWEFCAIYLDLVRFVMGKEPADLFKQSMREHNVRFKKPQKRVLTDEQRETLKARIAKAREAKSAK